MKSKTNAFADKVAQFFLPFVSVIDMSLSFCTATSSSDSLPGLFVFISMSAIKPLLLLLLLAGLICWSILIDSGIGLREFCVPLYLWLPEKGKKKERDQLTCSLTETWLCCGLITPDIQTKDEKKKHFHISPKLVSLVFDFDGLSAKLNSFMLSKKFQEMAKGYQKLCLEENTLTCILYFSIERQSKKSQRPITWKEDTSKSQWERKVKTRILLKARENAGDRDVISLSFASDWLIEWRQISEPIREQSKANQYSFASLWKKWEGVEDESLSIILLLCHTVIIVHIWSSYRVTSPSRVRMSFTVGYIFFCRLKNRYGFSLCKIETSQLKKDLWSEAKE